MEAPVLNEPLVYDDPSDWPADIKELRILDNLLRCSVCFEYFNIAVMATGCCHNYCSLCARKHISYKAQCPSCPAEMRQRQLKCNRVLDEIVKVFMALRPKLLMILKEHKEFKTGNQPEKDFTGKSCQRFPRQSKWNAPGTPSDWSASRKGIENERLPSEGDEDGTEGCDFEPAVSIRTKKQEESFQGSSTATLSSSDSGTHDASNKNKNTASCPVCSKNVHVKHINSHLDACLRQKVPKRKHRQQISERNGPDKKRRRMASGFKREDSSKSAANSDDAAILHTYGASAESETNCFAKNVLDSQLPRTASNQLLPAAGGNRLVKLPDLVISGLSDKQLRSKLKQHGLSSRGDKKMLQNRLKSYRLLYNSQCDAVTPMTVSDMVEQVESTEAAQKKLNKGRVLVQTYDLSKTETEKQNFNADYLIKHKDHFRSLINDVKMRGRASIKHRTETVATKAAVSDEHYLNDVGIDERENVDQKNDGSFSSQSGFPTASKEPFSLLQESAECHSPLDSKTSASADAEGANSTANSPARKEAISANCVEEFEAVESFEKAKSKTLTVVEKVHAAPCKDRAKMPSKLIGKISEADSGNNENSFDEKQKADLSCTIVDNDEFFEGIQSPVPIHEVMGGRIKDKSLDAGSAVRLRDGVEAMEEGSEEMLSTESIVIIDSDGEELENNDGQSCKHAMQSTPKTRFGKGVISGSQSLQVDAYSASFSEGPTSQKSLDFSSICVSPKTIAKAKDAGKDAKARFNDGSKGRKEDYGPKSGSSEARSSKAKLISGLNKSKNRDGRIRKKKVTTQAITSFFKKRNEYQGEVKEIKMEKASVDEWEETRMKYTDKCLNYDSYLELSGRRQYLQSETVANQLQPTRGSGDFEATSEGTKSMQRETMNCESLSGTDDENFAISSQVHGTSQRATSAVRQSSECSEDPQIELSPFHGGVLPRAKSNEDSASLRSSLKISLRSGSSKRARANIVYTPPEVTSLADDFSDSDESLQF